MSIEGLEGVIGNHQRRSGERQTGNSSQGVRFEFRLTGWSFDGFLLTVFFWLWLSAE